MNSTGVNRFLALLYRELLEHRNLFIVAPMLLAVLLLLFAGWLSTAMSPLQVADAMEYLSLLFNGLSPSAIAPLWLVPGIPFMLLLYCCGLVYLLNALYQERRDTSVLFWQSMPVSDTATVLSKVVTLVVVAPACQTAALLVCYLLGVSGLVWLGWHYEVPVAGTGHLLLAALTGLALVYLSMLVSLLWLLPTAGWLLLFSAFARRTPLLWAGGVFVLLGLLEDFVFGSQYLANWVASRSHPDQYMIYQFADFPARLFSYDMVFGMLLGAVLLTGAVVMRRFIE